MGRRAATLALLAALVALACTGRGVAQPPGSSPLPPDRLTTWNPGIPGGIPVVAAVHRTIDAAVWGDGKADATAAINQALESAGAAASAARRLAVVLPPGQYRITGSLNLRWSHVVLRGAGPVATRVRLDTRDEVSAVRMGVFWPDYHPAVDVVGSVPKGARSITLADASGIQAGDVLQLDQLDDPSYVRRGDQVFAKRGPRPGDANGPPSPGGYRSVGQQVEVAARQGHTLLLSGPTHIAFDAAFSPQVFKTATARPGEPGTRSVGLEDLHLSGGNNHNVSLMNVAYGWVRNVESDGDPSAGPGVSGAHLALVHAYRCEIRGSYLHHARSINPGGGAYGIFVTTQSSDNLIEDNIVRMLNKPVVFAGSGGGNVVGYNDVDDAFIASHQEWQESAIDANHGSFSHHDLFEGNLAPNIGSDSTHGNAGWQTFFRNHATGMNGTVRRTLNVRAVGIDGFNREHTVVGNVLLQPGLVVNRTPAVFLSTSRASGGAAAVYRVGSSAMGGPYEAFDDGTALRLLLRHGNFDHVTGAIEWDPRLTRDLPPSLYRSAKPAFFGDEPWPFVDPLRRPMVGVLPARKRFEAMR
ncbi:MAG: hypothetical protein IPO09_19615 [Anaeromyxobacter sp.]|nr:hypothetical protein [Anaeromyxobacter sp.]